METTSVTRATGTSDHAVARTGHSASTARIKRAPFTAESYVNRENKHRYKRKRTRSDEADTIAHRKRVRYSRYGHDQVQQSRPRHSSESTHAYHRREKGLRYNSPPTNIYRREHRRSESERHERRFHPPRSHEPHRTTQRHPYPDTPAISEARPVQYATNQTLTVAEGFIRSVSGTYKMMNRAEDRKRILSNQLPSCIKSKSIANSFIFCTSTDGDMLESEVASMRRHQKSITDFTRLDHAIHNVSCRIRRRPVIGILTTQQISTIRAVRIISIAFNRIVYVARIKHYCDRESRLSHYLRDQLTKRCSEGSRLNFGIRRFISCVNVEKYKDLCLILVGMLCQTPHMWARSIRLLSRLKIFFQNVIIKMFSDEKIDLREVFEFQYHSSAQKILSQVKQYTHSAFMLNDAVHTIADMIRQRQSISSTQSPHSPTDNTCDEEDYTTFSPPQTPTPRPDDSNDDFDLYTKDRSETSSDDEHHQTSKGTDTESSTTDSQSTVKTPRYEESDSDNDERQNYSDPFSPTRKSSSTHTSDTHSTSSCSSPSSSESSKTSSSNSTSRSACSPPPSPRRSPEPIVFHTGRLITSTESTNNDTINSFMSTDNFISVHFGRSSSPSPQMSHECINIMLETPN
uniref:Protein UL34 n=1 Tax=Mastomys natalensis cytomegalovirus 2 TaxID=2973540 RepID=A0A9Y1IQU6_9BETA|nr:protein UL34 [Mastomys natalensis cytomegalovirus 2]WEG69175.1 protein UL34 [Mastomys natalensis cytomegalovirus 2]WEG69314.1 protein UL34 [Mastomys natalensis cytomegalovirus 2]WEG69452.1 protein UL34 [Mastomys natalensis cytomegalovirus 2]WEG69590.1 protein UL34 [Mastomys natalensis cytomegalovirus 2]